MESDIETLGSDRVESLLSESPDTDDREDVVIEEIEDKDNDYLSVTKTMTRLGMVVLMCSVQKFVSMMRNYVKQSKN